MTHGDTVVYTVVVRLADAEGVSPEDLEYTLAEYVDPTVLERVGASRSSCRLTFEVPGYVVTVEDGGEVTVEPVSTR